MILVVKGRGTWNKLICLMLFLGWCSTQKYLFSFFTERFPRKKRLFFSLPSVLFPVGAGLHATSNGYRACQFPTVATLGERVGSSAVKAATPSTFTATTLVVDEARAKDHGRSIRALVHCCELSSDFTHYG